MGRSYSLDLRRRVVSRVEGGRSRRGAAADLLVSPSFSVKLARAPSPHRHIGPQRQGRPSGTGKLAPCYRRQTSIFAEQQPRETPNSKQSKSNVKGREQIIANVGARKSATIQE
jgi:hypothetical protein